MAVLIIFSRLGKLQSPVGQKSISNVSDKMSLIILQQFRKCLIFAPFESSWQQNHDA